jgi:hypothetical protein
MVPNIGPVFTVQVPPEDLYVPLRFEDARNGLFVFD